jgi:hypothetical protein
VVLIMFQKNSEQVSQVRFDLQFFAEPGGEPASPPMTEGNQNVVSPGTTSQAINSPDVTSGQVQTGQTPEQQLQAALSGMSAAQREKAAWEKTAREYGFNSVDEAKAAFQSHQEYQALKSNPLPTIVEILKSNPMQAAQIYGQIFNNQQPQASPYENITTYDEFGNAIIPEAVKAVDQKYNPRLTAVENFIQRQYESGIQTRENARISEFASKYPNAGITPEAVWGKVREIGIPLSTIDQQPWVVDGIITQIMGGLGKSIENLAGPIGEQKVKNYQQQVLSNATSTAQVTPTGGTVAATSKIPLQGSDQIKRRCTEWLIQ